MSENIQSISMGTYTIGQTSATNFVAGPGIKIDEPSAGTVRIGNDETVLWSGTNNSAVSAFNLSEQKNNFERIKVYGSLASTWGAYTCELPTKYDSDTQIKYATTLMGTNGDGSPLQIYGCSFSSNDGLSYSFVRSVTRWFSFTNTASMGGNTGTKPIITKIVGINRINGGNA